MSKRRRVPRPRPMVNRDVYPLTELQSAVLFVLTQDQAELAKLVDRSEVIARTLADEYGACPLTMHALWERLASASAVDAFRSANFTDAPEGEALEREINKLHVALRSGLDQRIRNDRMVKAAA